MVGFVVEKQDVAITIPEVEDPGSGNGCHLAKSLERVDSQTLYERQIVLKERIEEADRRSFQLAVCQVYFLMVMVVLITLLTLAYAVFAFAIDLIYPEKDASLTS